MRRDHYDINEDMQTFTQMRMADDLHAMRTGRRGRSSGGRSSSGLKGRGVFFWVMLIIMTYWFILKPLGLTITKTW